MNGLFGPHVAESGVKNGDDSDVGLVGPAEKDEGAVSVNTLDSDVLLTEWNGRRWFAKSNVSGLSVLTLRFSVLFLAGMGEDTPFGVVGEAPPGVCEFDGGSEPPSDSSAIEPFLDLEPRRLFFCLNFSSQLVLWAF
jgi:hypothetical protein